MFSDIFLQIQDYLLYCKSKNLSTKTIKSYEQSLKLFERYCTDNKIQSLLQITPQAVLHYIQYIQERGKYTAVSNDNSKEMNHPDKRKDLGKQVSPATINNYIRNLKAFFTYCIEFELIKKNPMKKIKYLPYTRKAKGFITDEQYQLLLKCFDLSRFYEYRDFVIVNLLFDTGMRISECLLIQTNDIDVMKRCILLLAENTKGKKDRYVFFSMEMSTIIKRWLKYKDIYTNTTFLFTTQNGTNINNSVFEKNFKKYCGRINLNDITPHALRNNFAKRFLMNGGNIYTLSQILGHSSVLITEKAYLDLTDDDIRQGYQNFSPLSKMKNK